MEPTINKPPQTASVISLSEGGTAKPTDVEGMVEEVELGVDGEDEGDEDQGSDSGTDTDSNDGAKVTSAVASSEEEEDKAAMAEGDDLFMTDVSKPKKAKTTQGLTKPKAFMPVSKSAITGDDDDDSAFPNGATSDGGPEDEDELFDASNGPEGASDDDDVVTLPHPIKQTTERQSAVISVWKPRCLECGHLVKYLDHKYKKCHYTKGNEDCPAQSVSITESIDLDAIVGRFLRAEDAGNNVVLGKMHIKLGNMPKWKQDLINEGIAEAKRVRFQSERQD